LHAVCLSISVCVLSPVSCNLLFVLSCPCILRYVFPYLRLISHLSPHTPSLTLPLPVLNLAQASLEWRKQAPRLHRSTQHSKAHQNHPRQGQNDGKCDPVCLDGVSHSEISRHVLGHEGEWKEQDGCFADEQRNPRKAVDSGRLRHGHELEVLLEYVSNQK
jgi:hypothetical protein